MIGRMRFRIVVSPNQCPPSLLSGLNALFALMVGEIQSPMPALAPTAGANGNSSIDR